jgi:hypothetical protein
MAIASVQSQPRPTIGPILCHLILHFFFLLPTGMLTSLDFIFLITNISRAGLENNLVALDPTESHPVPGGKTCRHSRRNNLCDSAYYVLILMYLGAGQEPPLDTAVTLYLLPFWGPG